ncbi:MAG: hypothetical protein HRT88_05120, partial [Lentisphaeraceae bacterium]|nr:hypothetical protein [Lentisphaeraceae bacterium]
MSNPTHFLDEIAFSIKTQDAIKLKVLLNEIPRLDDALIHQLLWKITGQEAYLSIPLILYISLYQPDTCLRYPKLEEILNDKFTSVREPFDIYEKLEEEFHPIFLEMWLSLAANKTDRDFEQFFNCGSKLNRMKILKYFYSKPQKTVHKITEGALKSDSINEVKTAVQAILKKPYDSIWPKLLVLIGLDADLDKLIIISYASSSKPDFNILIELLDSRHTRVRALVIDCFMQMKDHPKLFNALCDSLNSNYRALSKTILTLNLLRDFADAAAGQVIRQLIQAHPGDPNIRFCAYEALGAIHVGAGIFTLTTGLADPVEAVQVAAAKALE